MAKINESIQHRVMQLWAFLINNSIFAHKVNISRNCLSYLGSAGNPVETQNLGCDMFDTNGKNDNTHTHTHTFLSAFINP